MKATNKKYSIRNWSEYNKSLKKRGSITFWLSPDAIEKWLSDGTSKRGRPEIYSDEAILFALIIKSVYHLPYIGLVSFLGLVA